MNIESEELRVCDFLPNNHEQVEKRVQVHCRGATVTNFFAINLDVYNVQITSRKLL